jgi:hypothetical protein
MTFVMRLRCFLGIILSISDYSRGIRFSMRGEGRVSLSYIL